MVYGCLTCLQVIESICDAFYLDFAVGPGDIPLREKLIDLVPNLVININNACLCIRCANVVKGAFEFKQTALDSRRKIVAFLEQVPSAEQVAVEDIAKYYRVGPEPHSAKFELDIKPDVTKLVSTFVLNEDRYEEVSRNTVIEPLLRNRWEPPNGNHNVTEHERPALRWEPPPHLNDQSNDQAGVFQSPPVTNVDASLPVGKLKCRLCNYTCDENCMHAFHMILHENPNPPYRCGRCPAELPSREILLDHLARHTSENPYKCTVCFFTTNRYRRMKIHQDTHQKPFYCSICKERFRFEKEMKLHVADTHRSQLKCDLCKYQSKNKILLQQHKKEHLNCRTCGQAFLSLLEVDKHCRLTGHKKKFTKQ